MLNDETHLTKLADELSICPFINTHKAAVIIKYKNTQSTMNRKIYKRNKVQICKAVLKLGNLASSRTLVKLSRRLYPRKIFIHLL